MTVGMTRATQVLIDLITLATAFALAYLLRFDWAIPPWHLKQLLFFLPYVVAAQYFALLMMRVPRFAWRYVGLHEAKSIAVGLVPPSLVLLGIRIVAGFFPTNPRAQYAAVPISVILIDCLLAMAFILGARVARRVFAERRERVLRRPKAQRRVRTLLIGAGQAGVMVAKELSARPDLAVEPIGFVDDDPLKQGVLVAGLPILGATDALETIIARHRVDQALLTFSNVSGTEIRRVVTLCEARRLPLKVIPGLFEIVGGRVEVSRMRPVAIEDLLRRAPVSLDRDAIDAVIRGRVAMVTGAGGSIGSELCRQIARLDPKHLILVERSENNLFEIHRELVAKFPGIDIHPRLADIGDDARMRELFGEWKPHVVLHAAAHKHVPMMEWNPGEALKNNVVGTRRLADLAHEFGVQEFVMISTDKAVHPTSVMGATKRAAEVYVQALAQQSETRFITVRFGNVLGSAGSVIPIFQQQIANGGPVTVTDPRMTRYFMTIPEACQLVLQAATMGEGGEIFILDMGEPVRIVDLAHDLIRLSGFRPDVDIKVEFTGIRPGEKLFEELSLASEHADRTRHPKVYVGRTPHSDLSFVSEQLEEIERISRAGATNDQLRIALSKLVPELAGKLDESREDVSNAALLEAM